MVVLTSQQRAPWASAPTEETVISRSRPQTQGPALLCASRAQIRAKRGWPVLRRISLLLVFAITVVPAGDPQDDQGSETAVIRPLEIEDVLVNPGMGITTFKRFNGDSIKDGLVR